MRAGVGHISSDSPIAVLDSGLGGLTVAAAIHRALPTERIVYFGDTARLPYGSKSPATIVTFVRQILTYLRGFDPKHVVIACNTATALALPAVRSLFPDLTVTGVIDPGTKAAITAAGSKEQPTIGIIATEATIRSKAYERAIHRRRNKARLLLRPAPLLVPIIEEGRDETDPLVRLALRQYLLPMVERGLDVLILGCTHYPMLRNLIQELVGSRVAVIDSAEQCAEDVTRRLQSLSLLRSTASTTGNRDCWIKCFVTDNSPRFGYLASRFLSETVEKPTWIDPEQLYELESGLRVRAAV